MDPEFQRALIVVLIVGGAIATVGTLALVLVFRGFGKRGAGRPSHVALILALVVFVFACCAGLLLLSYR